MEAREGDLFAAATRRSGVLKRQLTAQDETIAALKDAVEREQRHVRKLMKENAVQRWAALSRVKQLQLANNQLVEVGWCRGLCANLFSCQIKLLIRKGRIAVHPVLSLGSLCRAT